MRTFAVSIPTKSYLRKYLHKMYGHPIALNHRSLIGSVILAFLNKKIYSDRSNPTDLYNTYTSFNDRLETVIPQIEVLNVTSGLNIEPAKVVVINRYFDNQFEDDLYHFCQKNLSTGRNPGYERCLNEFAKKYGIEFDEDITYEALKKMEYRYRKKIKENLTAFVPPSKHLQKSLFQ